MQVRRKTAVVGAAVAAPLLAISLLVYWYVYLGVPFPDEWQCSPGESPVYDLQGGGRSCFHEAGDLTAGATRDPLGNRPLSCDGRRGWTVIHRRVTEDCLQDGRQVPEGWTE